MKTCSKCGCELMTQETSCSQCGYGYSVSRKNSNVGAIKVFVILGALCTGVFGWSIIPIPLLPLLWCIPVSVVICNKYDQGEHVGIGLKIFTLLFVSLIGGILMLCTNDD